MEETSQKENSSEYKDPDDNQGGTRRRLRDRDLLRKRKAEAEEKATNQVESRRKRGRGEEKSSLGKRGRPRKTELTPELGASQEELVQETPAVEVVPEPEEVSPAAPTMTSLPPLLLMDPTPPEPQMVYVPAASAPIPLPAPALIPLLAPAPAPIPLLASVPIPLLAPAPAPALAQADTLYTDPQGSDPLGQVLVEDLGPDEEKNIPPSEDNRVPDQGPSEELTLNVPEQNKGFSIPTFTLPPQTQGNYF